MSFKREVNWSSYPFQDRFTGEERAIWRNRLGLSVKEVAEAFDITPRFVSVYECEESTIPEPLQKRIRTMRPSLV